MLRRILEWLDRRLSRYSKIDNSLEEPVQITNEEILMGLQERMRNLHPGDVIKVTDEELSILKECYKELNAEPRMIRNPLLAQFWDKLSDEEKVLGEIFHPDELPNIPGKIYFIKWPMYWIEA